MRAFLIALLLLAACAPTRPLAERGAAVCYDLSALAPDEQVTADSILAVGLDHEGLYTLAADVKPVSSLAQVSLLLARPDTVPEGVRAAAPPGFEDAAAHAARLYRIAAALRCGTVQTVVVPFRRADDGLRTLHVAAVDVARLDGILARDARFWAALGLTPGADPALVVTVTEHAATYDRWRGYGYLFGYPEEAVTFFVEAGREADSTGQFVERDFLHAPVFARASGHFTWAVPRGHTPTRADSLRLDAAAEVLAEYRRRRPAYLRPDSTLRAADLLRDWAREPRRSFAF